MALANIIDAPARIAQALQRAAKATGVDFDYLLKTAQRESSLEPTARARTSSAAGLFQFIENTWLRTIKQEGPSLGFGELAAQIGRTESGRYVVPDRAARKEILALRHDPEVSAMLAGAFTRQNAEIMTERLGREPTQGELYIAHFLGADAGAKLVELAGETPRNRADAHFPRAANANPSIFYSRKGPRSLAEVYRVLVSKHSSEPAMVARSGEGGEPHDQASAEIVATGRPAEPVFQARPGSAAGLGAIGAWQAIVLSEEKAEAVPSGKFEPAPARQPGVDAASYEDFQDSFWEQMRKGQANT